MKTDQAELDFRLFESIKKSTIARIAEIRF